MDNGAMFELLKTAKDNDVLENAELILRSGERIKVKGLDHNEETDTEDIDFIELRIYHSDSTSRTSAIRLSAIDAIVFPKE